ncbi:hypothetical protein FEF34_31520 [Streptomyces marianii]|uniref:Uncharacterized protein n=1 Tax=Streptomyces marianii TaxID=1817406 RepID=A0A5R9ECZ2_9ACTN|nr:hypothetical protein FEF34_31520 [Streptomyces marianii]
MKSLAREGDSDIGGRPSGGETGEPSGGTGCPSAAPDSTTGRGCGGTAAAGGGTPAEASAAGGGTSTGCGGPSGTGG